MIRTIIIMILGLLTVSPFTFGAEEDISKRVETAIAVFTKKSP